MLSIINICDSSRTYRVPEIVHRPMDRAMPGVKGRAEERLQCALVSGRIDWPLVNQVTPDRRPLMLKTPPSVQLLYSSSRVCVSVCVAAPDELVRLRVCLCNH